MFKHGFIFVVLIGQLTWPYIWCFSDGIHLDEYCATMVIHNADLDPQTSDPPFTITPSVIEATAGQTVEGETFEENILLLLLILMTNMSSISFSLTILFHCHIASAVVSVHPNTYQ